MTGVPAATAERVLVTGGLGFLGGWLSARLLDAGYRVTIVDVVPVAGSTAEALGLPGRPGLDIVHGDVTDPVTFAALGDDYDVVVHAAAVLGIDQVSREPVQTLDVNLRGTWHCLDFAVRQRQLRRFVLLSSSEVYGRRAVAARETDELRVATDSLRWAYAASKIAGEFMALAHQAEHELPVSVIRPFNVYGPYRSWANAMTIFVGRAIRNERIEVSGDGSQRRTWCHVLDFVDGVLRCLDRPEAVGETFNLGNPDAGLSVLELARLVVARTGSTSLVVVRDDDVPDVRDREPCIDKARRLLGFRPVVSIEEGIDLVAESMTRAVPRLAAGREGSTR